MKNAHADFGKLRARALRKIIVFQWLLVSQQVFGTPRTVVEQIATTVETNYFDASRAVEISVALRSAAAAGRFDALTDPGDLASAVSKRLQSFDHHFLVTWSADTTGFVAPTGPPHPVPQESDEFERRTAYGFHAVEMLSGAIGYIDLRSFIDLPGGQEDPARATADAALQLVRNADAIILDLRNNPGGSPDMVGYLVSAFTDPKADTYNVLTYRDHRESERSRVPYPNPRLDVPLYVVISGRTASAAESLAYTLQASRRAVIIGEISAGAANPGGPFPTLLRVHGDTFFVREEPYRRVIFQRDTADNIRRFQLLRAGGPSTWFARDSHLTGPR